MATRVDPYKSFRFHVEILGVVRGSFTECSGFGSNIEIVEYREGGDATTVRKLPGKTSYPDITLKWGLTDSRDLYDWHLSVVTGVMNRQDGSIILLNDLGEEKVRWNFFNAWPSKYDGPDFNAKGNEIAIDTLTLSCERLVRA